jgi:5-methylthioadenosine/S-adenosylhomocysteine deaminase
VARHAGDNYTVDDDANPPQDDDRFEQAYHTATGATGATGGATGGVADVTGSEGGVADGPHQPPGPDHRGFALAGCVLTPERDMHEGFVSIGPDGLIIEVSEHRPSSVPVVDTDGVILPGMIDLHGHPEFNVFAPWEPPTTFANRYQWRASDIYRRLIRDTQNRLLTALPLGTEERYAEIRALVGGVTAIQGASGREVTAATSLVRHVDLPIFGAARARTLIDLPFPGTPSADYLKGVVGQITAGTVDAFYLHLAEGRPDDPTSTAEFERMVSLGALTGATIVIHGTALTRPQLAQLADAGAALVWSPQSNLRLYGVTTSAADALAVGVEMAVGADWLPSGSLSLLAELKVARRVLTQQGHGISSRALVEMVTSGAAAIAGLGDHLGSLETGRAADVLVLERRHEDPWHNVVEAEPSWVDLVCVNGVPSYGRADWVTTADSMTAASGERLLAWGKEMLLATSTGNSATGNTATANSAIGNSTLGQLRAALIAQYPQTGPIFA